MKRSGGEWIRDPKTKRVHFHFGGYDVERLYLVYVMRRYGFCKALCKLILSYVRAAHAVDDRLIID